MRGGKRSTNVLKVFQLGVKMVVWQSRDCLSVCHWVHSTGTEDFCERSAVQESWSRNSSTSRWLSLGLRFNFRMLRHWHHWRWISKMYGDIEGSLRFEAIWNIIGFWWIYITFGKVESVCLSVCHWVHSTGTEDFRERSAVQESWSRISSTSRWHLGSDLISECCGAGITAGGGG